MLGGSSLACDKCLQCLRDCVGSIRIDTLHKAVCELSLGNFEIGLPRKPVDQPIPGKQDASLSNRKQPLLELCSTENAAQLSSCRHCFSHSIMSTLFHPATR